MSDPNQDSQTGGSQVNPEYFLLHRPNTPPQVVFAFEITGCDAFISEERARDCMDQLQTAFKKIPELNFRTSWDIPEATLDQAGVKESSSSNPK